MIFYNCGGDLEGTFYISDGARKYQIDTTITSIRLVDNVGISEEFYMDQNIWYTTHHYFSEWGTETNATNSTSRKNTQAKRSNSFFAGRAVFLPTHNAPISINRSVKIFDSNCKITLHIELLKYFSLQIMCILHVWYKDCKEQTN